MSRFTADWLALREPADCAARDPALAQRFAAALPPFSTILDLGAGTGANARALAPTLTRLAMLGTLSRNAGEGGTQRASAGGVREQRWVLIENDPALSALQPAHFQKLARDLAAGLGDLAADGVTAAALLDLAGEAWIEHLAEWLARRRVPFLAALTVDGRRDYWPADPEDAEVAASFARDQRRDKGLGPALGPAATGVMAASLARRGFSVATAASNWRLGPGQAALLAALVRGEAEAAGADGWGRRRLAQAQAGRLCARIGHRDLLALPPAN